MIKCVNCCSENINLLSNSFICNECKNVFLRPFEVTNNKLDNIEGLDKQLIIDDLNFRLSTELDNE